MSNDENIKNEEVELTGVPFGSYCYGYVPKPGSGFNSKREVDDYFNKKFSDTASYETFVERDEALDLQYCKFWNPTEYGFVCCSYLKIRAIWISDTENNEKKAIEFFGSEESMSKEVGV
jgi:hypothetical protein